MSLTTSEMTPADLAAVTGNCNNSGNGMWGGDGWWIIVLFLIWGIWGGGYGNGFGGGNGASGALTREQACIDNNFQNLMRETAGISDAVNLGFANLNSTICNQQYDTAGKINALGTTVQQGFNAQTIATLQGQNAIQTQLSGCCCDLRTGQMQIGNQIERGVCDTNYNATANTTAIIQNAHNDTDRVIARLDAMEAARKDEVIADLRSKLAACGDQSTAQYIINQLTGVINPRPVPAYPAASPCGLGNWSPQVVSNGYGYNQGCGCNVGCGCAAA